MTAPHASPAEDVLASLESDAGSGLPEEEARRRREEHGANTLAVGQRSSAAAMLLRQFADVLILVLVGAAVVSGAVLGEWVDAGVIAAIVVLNAVLGFVQEHRAENALARLRELSVPQATVVRDGTERDVPAPDVVPGDVVLLEAGDRVPADGRVIAAEGLSVDEAVLTGESFPVGKHTDPVDDEAALADRTSMAFMGTSVQNGRGRLVVTATGAATAMGDIAGLLASEERRATPLQRDLARLGRRLAAVAIGLAGLLFGAGLLRGMEVEELFLVTVALAVAAIPEGLPAVVTVTLATGVSRMARECAIVRRLPAVEALGAATVICTDKTGTLTMNRITVQRLVTSSGLVEQADLDADDPVVARYVEVAAACNDAHTTGEGVTGDPTEIALVESVTALGVDPEEVRRRLPRRAEIGFSSDRKRMTTVHDADGRRLVFLKGAPEVVLERVGGILAADGIRDLTGEDRDDLEEQALELAKQGLRVLALAYRELDGSESTDDLEALEHDLVLVALAGMSDELRAEVPEAVGQARRAGIRVVLVTGDHRDTATTIGRDSGIADPGDETMTGRQLEETNDEQLAADVERVAVYARVDPRHKVTILRAWQRRGGIVAMTGDGVNDAPALQSADIGVAMGSGTDVAKDAGDMVLVDDNFATIVAAVREGRRIFSDIAKAVHFLLSANLAEIFVVSVGVLAFGHLGEPLLATQILWINLVTDGVPVLALGLDPAARDVMERPPRRSRKLLGRRQQGRLVIDGGVLAGAALLTFVYGHLLRDLPFPHVRTLLFTALAFVQFAQLYNIRAGHRSALDRTAGRNRLLAGAVVVSAVLQALVVHTAPGQALFDTVALGGLDWLVVGAVVLVAFAGVDAVKRLAGPIDPEA